jgi:phosphate:Na+ symporter
MALIQSLIWLLAGVGIFIVGMNFLSGALEKSAGSGMKNLLEKISNNRFSGVGIGAGVTAIIQSSSATSVMVIGLVNAGVMTLMQATPIIMGANIGTTITGVIVALKNDYFNMLMYFLAFAGVMMGFFKKEKIKLAGLLCSGLGLIFVGLNIMGSEDAFKNPLIMDIFTSVFEQINFPLVLILVGAIFTALIQSSSAATGVVITMVGTGVLPLDLALFIILGANIGTCVTALLASVGANANSKRVALIHFTFNTIGTAVFTALIWIFKEPAVDLLVTMFPGDDPMSLQMRVSAFHVVFNVTTTLILLPFVKQLVDYSCFIIKDKKETEEKMMFKYVDERLLSTPHIAITQVKKEIEYMFDLVEENTTLALVSVNSGSAEYDDTIRSNEKIINFTNNSLTKFLIELSTTNMDQTHERVIGSYFHVLNDLERIGDHAENLHEIGLEMMERKIAFSDKARAEIGEMSANIIEMFRVSKDIFENSNKEKLPTLANLEECVDAQKKELISSHFARLADGNCHVDVSPYFSSVIVGFERMGDHLVNVGYSINNPTGSQKENV